MKSTGTGLSLSLRLRMEGESSMNLSKKFEGMTLPIVTSSSNSSTSSSHSSYQKNQTNQTKQNNQNNQIIMPTKSKTHVAAENTVKSKNVAARLSGTLSYTTGGTANLVDRAQTLRPSNCCVRCSVHASICMDCCDLQTQKAVAFYRRTLGKGASAILSQAIMEAGLATMSKFVIFSLWKNGTFNRNLSRDKKMREVTRQCNDKMMKAPLLAWRKFTKDELMIRKNATIKELQAKVRLLENQIGTLVTDKEIAEEAVGTLNDKLVFSVTINDDYIETIRVLKTDLADEKKRVVSLAGLCEPVRNLSNVLDTYGQGECNSFVENLVDSGCNVLTYDYSKVFNLATRDVILNAFALREERKVNPSTKTRYLIKLESEATAKMLLQWANYISRECCNSINEPTEDDDLFESQLPRHEQIYDFKQFNTGRTLSRVVFYLLYCGQHTTKEIIQPFSAENNNNNSIPLSGRNRAPSQSRNITPTGTPSKGTQSGQGTPGSIGGRKQSESSNFTPRKGGEAPGFTPRKASESNFTPRGRKSSVENENANRRGKKSIDNSSQPMHPMSIVNAKRVNPVGFDFAHILPLKEAENDPKILIDLTLKSAAEFLAIPVYNSQDVLDGKKFEIMTILGHLFLASAPTRDESDYNGIREMLLEYDDLSAHLTDLRGRLGYSTRSVKDIKEALKEYLTPLDLPEMKKIKRNSVSYSKRSSVSSTGSGGGGGSLSVAGVGNKSMSMSFDPVLAVLTEVTGGFTEQDNQENEKNGSMSNRQNIGNTNNGNIGDNGNNGGFQSKLTIDVVNIASASNESDNGSLGGQDEGDVIDEEEFVEPEVQIDYELIKYTKLQKVIDKLVNSNELNLLEDSITAMTNNVKRLAEMRKNISVSQKKKNDGIRIATDVRSFVAKNCFQNLVTPLGLVTVET